LEKGAGTPYSGAYRHKKSHGYMYMETYRLHVHIYVYVTIYIHNVQLFSAILSPSGVEKWTYIITGHKICGT